MKESRNIFLLDGPIGRKRFFITIGFLILYTIICTIICSFLIGFRGFDIYTKYIVYTIVFTLFIMMFYIIILTFAKRIQDITGISKWKCLLYVILYYIAITAIGAIPIIKYIAPFIGFTLFICLATIKGNLYSDNPDVIETEVIEEKYQEN